MRQVVLGGKAKPQVPLVVQAQCARHVEVKELLLRMKMKDDSPCLVSAGLAYCMREVGESVFLQLFLLQERVSNASARLAYQVLEAGATMSVLLQKRASKMWHLGSMEQDLETQV